VGSWARGRLKAAQRAARLCVSGLVSAVGGAAVEVPEGERPAWPPRVRVRQLGELSRVLVVVVDGMAVGVPP
jgi:hypothetical protein